jgi:hypothetical protein
VPEDYKALIARYGSGTFGEFLSPLNPFTANPHGGLVRRGRALLDSERGSGMWPHQGVPFALYPDAGGLFPWAVTDNGDRLFWYTHRAFDRWPVVVWAGRSFRFEVYQRTAAGFLREWLSGRLAVGVFPAGPYAPVFIPAEARGRTPPGAG